MSIKRVFHVICILAASIGVCLKAYSQDPVRAEFVGLVPLHFDLVSDVFDANRVVP